MLIISKIIRYSYLFLAALCNQKYVYTEQEEFDVAAELFSWCIFLPASC